MNEERRQLPKYQQIDTNWEFEKITLTILLLSTLSRDYSRNAKII